VNDVRISQPHFLLTFPTNLVQIEPGITVNGFVLFIPFTVTTDGQCKVNHIRLGSNAQLGNHCTIQPGANIAERTLVGTMTRITEETSTADDDDASPGSVVLGIPARLMPFQRDTPISVSVNKLSPYIYSDLACAICVQFFIKVIISFLFIHAYLLLPTYFLLVEHFISLFFFALPREIRSLDRINHWRYQLSAFLTLDFYTFVAPLLGGTQWLAILLRRLKANIGQDVIIGEMNAVEDWEHVTIGSHVRLSATAKVQVRDN
jgi:acetyltransferase-like isoleucine patch superfamily enzyme